MKYYTSVFTLLFLLAMGCDSGVGACQSSPVSYSYGQRVYCYNNYNKAECQDHDKQQVNGADWYFHAGQTCSDRGLTEGSNPWP